MFSDTCSATSIISPSGGSIAYVRQCKALPNMREINPSSKILQLIHVTVNTWGRVPKCNPKTRTTTYRIYD